MREDLALIKIILSAPSKHLATIDCLVHTSEFAKVFFTTLSVLSDTKGNPLLGLMSVLVLGRGTSKGFLL